MNFRQREAERMWTRRDQLFTQAAAASLADHMHLGEAFATENPRGARIEHRRIEASVTGSLRFATSAGRPNSSASRPATRPSTPGDQSPDTAMSAGSIRARASWRVANPSAPSAARAASSASREISRRSRFSASSCAESSAASSGSSVVSRSSAGRASPIRPAELMRGASVKPTTSTRCGPSAPALARSA